MPTGLESTGAAGEGGFDEDPESGEAVVVPITGDLDLHAFRPDEIGSLIPEYLRECRRLGRRSVRIAHGKGTGTLREGVHRLLDRLPEVLSYRPGDEGSGGWGATWVDLAPWEVGEEPEREQASES